MHIFLVFTATRNQLPKLLSFFHILITDGHCVVYLLYYVFDLDLSHIILRNNFIYTFGYVIVRSRCG